MLIKKLEKKVKNQNPKFFPEHIEEKVVSLSCEDHRLPGIHLRFVKNPQSGRSWQMKNFI